MSFEWNDKRNDVDDVNAEDINYMAHEILRLGRLANTNSSYPYVEENMDEHLAMVQLQPNTVTYTYGNTTESGTVSFVLFPEEKESSMSEESVLILDLSASVIAPTVSFENDVKWFNGEPPEIVAGKIYMFSFVRVKRSDRASYFYIGVGGEFA